MIIVFKKLLERMKLRRRNFLRYRKIFVFGFVPIFISYTALGVIWYMDIYYVDKVCLDDNSNWIVTFWLFLYLMLVCIYIMALFALVFNYFKKKWSMQSSLHNQISRYN